MRAAATTAVALGAALLAACSSGPAVAAGAQVCMDRADMRAALKDRHGERPVGNGITTDGWLIDILADAHGRTWTILATEPGGESCVLLTGFGWQQTGPTLGWRT